MSGQRFLSHFAVIDESFAVWQVNSDPSSLWQIDTTPPVQSESQLLLLGKVEYGGGPIFKVVLQGLSE